MSYDGGAAAYVRFLDRSKTAALIPEPIMIRGEKDGISVEVALWWNDSYHEKCCPSPTTSRSAMAARIWRAFAVR